MNNLHGVYPVLNLLTSNTLNKLQFVQFSKLLQQNISIQLDLSLFHTSYLAHNRINQIFSVCKERNESIIQMLNYSFNDITL